MQVLATGHKKWVEIASGPRITPARRVSAVRAATVGWKYDAVSIGYHGAVVHGRPIMEPRRLGSGSGAVLRKRRRWKERRTLNRENVLPIFQRLGQSIWLDYRERRVIPSGELPQLIEEYGLRGVTSNLSISMNG